MNVTIEQVKVLLGEKELVIFHLTQEVARLKFENDKLKEQIPLPEIVDIQERRGF